MDYEFKSQKELFIRVRPALRSKCLELHKIGFIDIKEFDIWNYLIIKKWKESYGLMLSDIVSDIMNLNGNDIYKFLEDKKLEDKRMQTLNSNLDVIWGDLHER